MNQPEYPNNPIGSIKSLALVLGASEGELLDLSENSDDYFFKVKEIIKPDKTKRLTFDARSRLKRIHGRIVTELLAKVEYPDYLQGSLKGKDYISNARKHLNKKFIISEDATNFFPSITQSIVHQVWMDFFNFPYEVADCLTKLCTFKGNMVQGAKTSSYIANLVLWRREYELVKSLKKRQLIYTRYVDDITVSSPRNLSKKEISKIISEVYGMLKTIGAAPNLRKHSTMSNSARQSVHRVNVNRSVATLPNADRLNIRAAVHNCEQMFLDKPKSQAYKKLYATTMGRVNALSRLHPNQGNKLKSKLTKIKPRNLSGT